MINKLSTTVSVLALVVIQGTVNIKAEIDPENPYFDNSKIRYVEETYNLEKISSFIPVEQKYTALPETGSDDPKIQIGDTVFIKMSAVDRIYISPKDGLITDHPQKGRFYLNEQFKVAEIGIFNDKGEKLLRVSSIFQDAWLDIPITYWVNEKHVSVDKIEIKTENEYEKALILTDFFEENKKTLVYIAKKLVKTGFYKSVDEIKSMGGFVISEKRGDDWYFADNEQGQRIYFNVKTKEIIS